ncbi:MAG: cysteine desulfurase family protein [Bacteroidota bacterium]
MDSHLHTLRKTSIYLDNAATTPIDPEVLQAMMPYLSDKYGNPSTIYAQGSVTRVAIEDARRSISELIGAQNGHIFFTSGGTESNNWAIRGVVEKENIRHIITSPIEHKSVLEVIQSMEAQHACQMHHVKLDKNGNINYEDLEGKLKKNKYALVSLMHGNNEIGTISDLQKIGSLCKQYEALFHTDMVQTMAYEPINLAVLPIDLAAGSAHKFHAPKGVGFLYINDSINIAPLLYGGSQERSLRGGTENVASIVAMAKGLEIAVRNQEKHRRDLYQLKRYFIQRLQSSIPNVVIYGDTKTASRHLCSILSVGLPKPYNPETLLFHLDIEGIATSSGSACMSGTSSHSHVFKALGVSPEKAIVRFSFSKYNTLKEIDRVVHRLIKIGKNN